MKQKGPAVRLESPASRRGEEVNRRFRPQVTAQIADPTAEIGRTGRLPRQPAARPQRSEGATTPRHPRGVDRLEPRPAGVDHQAMTTPNFRPPGQLTTALGALLALAGTVACLYLWVDTPATAVLCAICGWGFGGVIWALATVAGQIRNGQRRS